SHCSQTEQHNHTGYDAGHHRTRSRPGWIAGPKCAEQSDDTHGPYNGEDSPQVMSSSHMSQFVHHDHVELPRGQTVDQGISQPQLPKAGEPTHNGGPRPATATGQKHGSHATN